MQIVKKWLLGATTVALTGALALGGAIAASADPSGTPTYRSLPGVGSDTTQDLNNGLSQVVKSGTTKLLGSYDATGGGTIQTRSGGANFTRPNGSGEGVAALSAAITGSTYRGTTLNYADVKFARSSSGPASPNTSGVLQYIPLALDAVTYATINNTVIPSGIPQGTSATDATGTTAAPAALTLRNIFQGNNSYISGTIGSTTYQFYVGTGTPASGWPKLDVYVPQSGSGTRNFWASTLGFSNSTLPAGVTDTYSGGSVQEHDGSALVGDPTAIVPFSIAQYIAQGNATSLSTTYGVTVVERRHGAILNSVGSVAPTTTSGTLNTAFPIARFVYTVVESAAITTGNPAYNSTLVTVFVGTSGLAYSGSVITDFGFGALDKTSGTTVGSATWKPGDTPTTLRANTTSIP